VIARNLNRRHLDASQRAMIAAELATMARGRPEKASNDALISDATAARLLNVSEPSVERAKALKRDAAPNVVDAVRAGVSMVCKFAHHSRGRRRAAQDGDQDQGASDPALRGATERGSAGEAGAEAGIR
jgi:hypothetical protein